MFVAGKRSREKPNETTPSCLCTTDRLLNRSLEGFLET